MTTTLLDPDVVLHPLSFAVHVAALADHEHPLAVPIGWLWGEMDRRYTTLNIADACGYFESIDDCLEEDVQLSADPLAGHFVVPMFSIALLVAGCHLGVLRPVFTRATYDSFKADNWSGYLGDQLSDTVRELPITDGDRRRVWTLATARVATETRQSVAQITELYERNSDFMKRTSAEMPIYLRLHQLLTSLQESMAAVSAKGSVSTANPATHDVLAEALGRRDATFVPGRRLEHQPLVERVLVSDRRVRVRDVFDVIGARGVARLLGGADELAEVIVDDANARRIAHETALYMLGFVPVIDELITAADGLQLVRRLYQAAMARKPRSAADLLYYAPSQLACGHAEDLMRRAVTSERNDTEPLTS